ncbi:hypothetical protein N7G274_007441 [Stereocaulon virgatum]|uniref:Uncharacterized protein n=1 Tax=Stereocaulon virgatum TaxID=373712 RepID=A0ABR4A4P2_9LECA
MTPHLHPRSRLTTSLFGTTLLVSFLLVGMPHIIPCPAPRLKFADGEFEITEDGKRIRRRRPANAPNILDSSRVDEIVPSLQISEEEKVKMRRTSHECPIPKPRGFIGEVLGFGKEDTVQKLPGPRVETTKVLRSRSEAE